MINLIENFRAAIAAAGPTPPNDIRIDGELERFSSSGRPSDDAGWYVMYGDGVSAGVFGCWREGLKQYWCGQSLESITLVEREIHRHRANAMREKRAGELKLRYDKVKQIASARWLAEYPITTHPYPLGLQLQPRTTVWRSDDIERLTQSLEVMS